jgi:hypothetical protein
MQWPGIRDFEDDRQQVVGAVLAIKDKVKATYRVVEYLEEREVLIVRFLDGQSRRAHRQHCRRELELRG